MWCAADAAAVVDYAGDVYADAADYDCEAAGWTSA